MATAKSRSAKLAKGQRLQKWVCERISYILNLPWGTDQEIASRQSGQHGIDVILSQKAIDLFPWSIECKNQESWSVHEWIKQAKTNVRKGTNWVLFAKRNNSNPVAIIDGEVFLNLLNDLMELQNLATYKENTKIEKEKIPVEIKEKDLYENK